MNLAILSVLAALFGFALWGMLGGLFGLIFMAACAVAIYHNRGAIRGANPTRWALGIAGAIIILAILFCYGGLIGDWISRESKKLLPSGGCFLPCVSQPAAPTAPAPQAGGIIPFPQRVPPPLEDWGDRKDSPTPPTPPPGIQSKSDRPSLSEKEACLAQYGMSLGDQTVPDKAERKTVFVHKGALETVFLPHNRAFWIRPETGKEVLVKFFNGPLYLRRTDEKGRAEYYAYRGNNPANPAKDDPWEARANLNHPTSGNIALRLPPWSQESTEVLFAITEAPPCYN